MTLRAEGQFRAPAGARRASERPTAGVSRADGLFVIDAHLLLASVTLILVASALLP